MSISPTFMSSFFSMYVFLKFDFILFCKKIGRKAVKNWWRIWLRLRIYWIQHTSISLVTAVPNLFLFAYPQDEKKEKLAYHRLKNFSLTRILRTPWDFRLATADFWHYKTQLLRSDLIYVNFYQYDQIS